MWYNQVSTGKSHCYGTVNLCQFFHEARMLWTWILTYCEINMSPNNNQQLMVHLVIPKYRDAANAVAIRAGSA